MNMTTGYFASLSTRPSKVHLVQDGRPACGAKVEGEYLWCGNGIVIEYLNCSKCRKIARKQYEAQVRRLA